MNSINNLLQQCDFKKYSDFETQKFFESNFTNFNSIDLDHPKPKKIKKMTINENLNETEKETTKKKIISPFSPEATVPLPFQLDELGFFFLFIIYLIYSLPEGASDPLSFYKRNNISPQLLLKR